MENKENNTASNVSDTGRYRHKLSVSNPLREPTLRKVIRALQLPLGSRGLDAGCGIGFQAILLAEAVGAAGHVTGLDVSPEFLYYAREMVKKSGWQRNHSFPVFTKAASGIPRGTAESELSSEDWAIYQRLCQPQSPDCILNLPDYYAFFTYSLFRGKVSIPS